MGDTTRALPVTSVRFGTQAPETLLKRPSRLLGRCEERQCFPARAVVAIPLLAIGGNLEARVRCGVYNDE